MLDRLVPLLVERDNRAAHKNHIMDQALLMHHPALSGGVVR